MSTDAIHAIGYRSAMSDTDREREYAELVRHASLQLHAMGLPSPLPSDEPELHRITSALTASCRRHLDLLEDDRCPADARIEEFLARYFADESLDEPLRLPSKSFVLDRHGLARVMSLPAHGDSFRTPLVESYRVRNGVLNNPRSDRRTTAGTFHVAEGGLPIPGDKKSVPKSVFAKLFRAAVAPPFDLARLPFTSDSEEQAAAIVSLLLRPKVRPEAPGLFGSRSMEVRLFVPGSLVSNLDFVESIFGNAGDPWLPENDAGADIESWSGHTGCVILAPHISYLTKKELGLPHHDDATERQRRDGMCWRDAEERYNDGTAFKLTCRDESGAVVTLIADNYYGYCKKEVKTQISFAANLMGDSEEEHAGGAIAYASYSLGDHFQADSQSYNNRTFADVKRDYGSFIDFHPDGYGTDTQYPDLVYVPERAFASLRQQCVRWKSDGVDRSIPLLPGKIYMTPSGYKVRMEKHPAAPTWRLIGTVAEGVFCHKPSTVSGGGKSEISKSLIDYMLYGPVYVGDIERDLDEAEKLIDRDYSDRWRPDAEAKPDYSQRSSRPLLDKNRSLGSVIKLLTPSQDYTKEYNGFLKAIPNRIRALVYTIKRFQEPSWGPNWREKFGVDTVNGESGHELKFGDRRLIGSYLRVGYYGSGQWRTFKLRQDFSASAKIQTEDDITASTVVPADRLNSVGPHAGAESVKLAENCEFRLFQRPDEAINRGFDKQAEADLAGRDNFISNFEPLPKKAIEEMMTKAVDFEAFSDPMKKLLRDAVADEGSGFVVCSSDPRRIDGKPTKNPRYLQNRPDLVRPFDYYVAEMGMRLFRGLPADAPVVTPVHAVLMGRRNNPPEPEKGIRQLAVYSPIHYQELPELFMDFVASLTGKSPSTTGFGSEGALTKSPFNCLRTAADLNNALVAFLLTGLPGFSTPAGHIGPNVQVDHDISLLVPEVWCRLRPEERDPAFLIANRYLEKLEDRTYAGRTIETSRLGYRITDRFVRHFFGRVFDNPDRVFDEAMLQPESQDERAFYEGVEYIAQSQQAVAARYIEDGTIDALCPPLATLVRIMADGSCDGLDAKSPEFRELFTREKLVESDWYAERLEAFRQREVARCDRIEDYLKRLAAEGTPGHADAGIDIESRMAAISDRRRELLSGEFFERCRGRLGADPMGGVTTSPYAASATEAVAYPESNG